MERSAAPHYEIQRVNVDGSSGPVEVLPIVRPPWNAASGRRGFLGAGIASSVAAALLLGGCGTDEEPQAPPSSPTPSSEEPTYEPTDEPTDEPTYEPTEPDPPTFGDDDGGGGGGGQICTCNKVCTCIPICQAHRLLSPDPVVRRMAEVVVVAMGVSELAYLRWAASGASGPLRARIEGLVDEVCWGRRVRPDDLDDVGCEPYLDSGDPVVALMAAQVIVLRALLIGTGVTGAVAGRVARALVVGHALHRERAPAWRES